MRRINIENKDFPFNTKSAVFVNETNNAFSNSKQQKYNLEEYYINGQFLFDWTEKQNNIVNWVLKKILLLNKNDINKVKENIIGNNKTDYVSWIRAACHVYSIIVFDYLEEVINNQKVNLSQYMRQVSKTKKDITNQEELTNVITILKKYISDNKFKIVILSGEDNIEINFDNVLNKVIQANCWSMSETIHLTLLLIFDELFMVEDNTMFVSVFNDMKNILNKYDNMNDINVFEFRNLAHDMLRKLKNALNEDLINIEKGGRI